MAYPPGASTRMQARDHADSRVSSNIVPDRSDPVPDRSAARHGTSLHTGAAAPALSTSQRIVRGHAREDVQWNGELALQEHLEEARHDVAQRLAEVGHAESLRCFAPRGDVIEELVRPA